MLFLTVIAVVIYKLWPQLNPELVVVAPLDSECDLRAGPCVGLLPGGGEISFSIEPKEIPLVVPLRLGVELKGLFAHNVEVDFIGIGMQMGFNRSQLRAEGSGRFSGKGVLPVCIRSAMEWEARVMVHTDKGVMAAPFRFITVKQGVTLPER
ncbi:MAG: hypothetical protein GY814_04005 [Gammaproteobacteria bacterium]|nr:hypothetical protein [Gammaproteobacteria bacterium]